MASMLLEDTCIDCNRNNGINSGKNCKFCNELLCKNVWELELKSMSNFVMSTTIPIDPFSKFLLSQKYTIDGKEGYMYNFPFNQINIDFDKEVIIIKINGLKKPLIIRFESIMKYDIEKHQNNNQHMLTIYLKNMLVIGLGYNEFNLKIYEIFNKWVNDFNI